MFYRRSQCTKNVLTQVKIIVCLCLRKFVFTSCEVYDYNVMCIKVSQSKMGDVPSPQKNS